MKLLSKVGDALLTKFVPGIDASAGCGRCRTVRCECCGSQNRYTRPIGYDNCGNLCQWFNCLPRRCPL